MPSVGARAEAAAEGLELEGRDLTSRSNAVKEAVPFNGKVGAASARPVLSGNGEGGMDDRFSEGSKRYCTMRSRHHMRAVRHKLHYCRQH